MYNGPVRGGTRGGQGDFRWSDVKDDKYRENYLGHTVNAATGRWQQNKDIHWYSRDKDVNPEDESQRRRDEIRQLKEQEEEALTAALGFAPTKKNDDDGEGTGANNIPVKGELERQERGKDEERKREKAQRKEDRAARRAERYARREERDGRYRDEDRDRDRDRDRDSRRHRDDDRERRHGRDHRDRSRDRRDHSRDRDRDYPRSGRDSDRRTEKSRHDDHDRERERERRSDDRDRRRDESPRRSRSPSRGHAKGEEGRPEEVNWIHDDDA